MERWQLLLSDRDLLEKEELKPPTELKVRVTILELLEEIEKTAKTPAETILNEVSITVVRKEWIYLDCD